MPRDQCSGRGPWVWPPRSGCLQVVGVALCQRSVNDEAMWPHDRNSGCVPGTSTPATRKSSVYLDSRCRTRTRKCEEKLWQPQHPREHPANWLERLERLGDYNQRPHSGFSICSCVFLPQMRLLNRPCAGHAAVWVQAANTPKMRAPLWNG